MSLIIGMFVGTMLGILTAGLCRAAADYNDDRGV